MAATVRVAAIKARTVPLQVRVARISVASSGVPAVRLGRVRASTATVSSGSATVRVAEVVAMAPNSVVYWSAGKWVTTLPSTNTGQIKVWNGTGWVKKPVKVWTGTAWVQKPVKFWNGTAWVTTK